MKSQPIIVVIPGTAAGPGQATPMVKYRALLVAPGVKLICTSLSTKNGPIETSVVVYRETDKAYFGDVIVHECDSDGRVDILFKKEKTWIPKSMCDSPWWICTKMFDHPDKVANKRFEDDY